MTKTLTLAALALALAACSPAPTTTASTDQQSTAPRAAIIPTDVTHATVTAPIMGQKIKSPFSVTGVAPNNWFFEASFPVTLVDDNNQTLAQIPAQAQSDWTVQGPINFKADLSFLVMQETHATIVLEEDMPGENATPREVRIPVVLEPGR